MVNGNWLVFWASLKWPFKEVQFLEVAAWDVHVLHKNNCNTSDDPLTCHLGSIWGQNVFGLRPNTFKTYNFPISLSYTMCLVWIRNYWHAKDAWRLYLILETFSTQRIVPILSWEVSSCKNLNFYLPFWINSQHNIIK